MLPFTYSTHETIDDGHTQFGDCVITKQFGPYCVGDSVECIDIVLLESRIYVYDDRKASESGYESWKGSIALSITV